VKVLNLVLSFRYPCCTILRCITKWASTAACEGTFLFPCEKKQPKLFQPSVLGHKTYSCNCSMDSIKQAHKQKKHLRFKSSTSNSQKYNDSGWGWTSSTLKRTKI